MKTKLLFAWILVEIAPFLLAGENLIENGSFEAAAPVFRVQGGNEYAAIKIYKGNPLPDDKTFPIKKCLEINLLKDKTVASWPEKLFVDPKKQYRIKCKVCVPDAGALETSGYAFNSENQSAPLKIGNNTWQYGLKVQIGESGWQEIETTLGPYSDFILPEAAEWIGLQFWFSKGPAKFYVADLSMEEIIGDP
jgi:hypothetical protein